jgi:integrase
MSNSKAFQKVEGVQCLYQRAGIYYGRISVAGKQTWRSLDTDKKRTAIRELARLQTGRTPEVRKRDEPTLHHAIDEVLRFRRIRRGVSRPLSPETVRYHGELAKLAKGILPDRKLGSFSDEEMLTAISKCGLSESRRKAVFELFKGAFKRAVEAGQVPTNPLSGHVPAQVPRKERELPTREQLEQICEQMEAQFPEQGKAASLTAQFLAFSGLRWSEARGVEWKHVTKDKLRVEGLNGRLKTARSRRKIQINQPLRAVLNEIASIYGKRGRVMPMVTIRTYLAQACASLGLEKVGHHDLRSWFCTWCLSSRVDVNTTADWLGDDPTTVLRVYAQMNEQHKLEAAGKLK